MLENDWEETTPPDIFFDEEDEEEKATPFVPGKSLFTAKQVLEALECLLTFVHNGRELKFLQLRLRGLSLREISRETHCSNGAVTRFFLRIRKNSPEVGNFLEHTPWLCGKDAFPLQNELPSGGNRPHTFP